MVRVTVIGTTSWGTTLAVILARRHVTTHLWARTSEEASLLSAHGENQRLLPGVTFPPSMKVTSSTESIREADMVLLAVPSSTLRFNVQRIRDSLSHSSIILSATKGLEKTTGKRMSQVIEEELPSSFHDRIAVLSGPNLSAEITQEKPSSTVVASRDPQVAETVQQVLSSHNFRVYTNNDVTGVELGGALKNIIAIGAGISDGLGYGANAKAAFLTRGLAEITRLGVAAGANPLTLAGLAGLGDLVATSFSPLSRNHNLGEHLALGRSLQEALTAMKHVAEGVDTTVAAMRLAEEFAVEMPILNTTYQVLFQGLDPRKAVSHLMGRAPGPEWPKNLSHRA